MLDVIKLREKKIICFERNKIIWVYIDSPTTFRIWINQLGFESLTQFTAKTLLTVNDVYGTTIGYNSPEDVKILDAIFKHPEKFCFASAQIWWNSLKYEQIEAVMNEKVLSWPHNSLFISTKTEIEFALYIMDQFAKVSGWEVREFLSRLFMKQSWDLKADTTKFFKAISQALIKKFNIEYQKTSDVKYYI